MLVNTLIHREMTSSYIANFVIEQDRMFVENANRAVREGVLTPDNFEPNPKNPIIAAFFRNIGLSDQLGSGVRNLFKYGKLYSGKEPELIEGDIFRIIVPLDDNYSFDADTKKEKVGGKAGEKVGEIIKEEIEYTVGNRLENKPLTKNQQKIVNALYNNPTLSAKQLAEIVGISSRKVESNIKRLKEMEILFRVGSPKKGYWKLER